MALDRGTAQASRSTSLVLSLASLASLVMLATLATACMPAPKNEAEAEAGATGAAAPDPLVVCQHVRTLAAKDISDEQALDTVQRQCVQALEGLETRYATFASCVESATTSAAVVQCETALAKPPSLLGAASPSKQIEGICDHVIGLLKAGIPDMGQSVGEDEVAQLRQRCITEASAKLQSVGAEAFAQQSACLLAATDLATLQACGGF